MLDQDPLDTLLDQMRRLSAAGVTNTQELICLGGTPAGRVELAEKTGFSEVIILE